MNTFFESFEISDVWLRVLDLDAVSAFYRDILGLKEIERNKQFVRLSASGKEPAQVVLVGEPGAQPRARTSPGLFHTAFLVPSRRDLAAVVRRIGEKGWRFQGFADHGVSEAAYLADPEGNGIEVYHDRSPEEWPTGASGISMMTEPLDVAALVAENPQAGALHDDTRIGHIHLQISSLENAEGFYGGILGLDITQRTYPGALFLSAAGYHHHVGLNVWNSRGAPPAPAGSTGLMSFGISMETPRTTQMLNTVKERGIPVDLMKPGIHALVDPDGLSVVVRS